MQRTYATMRLCLGQQELCTHPQGKPAELSVCILNVDQNFVIGSNCIATYMKRTQARYNEVGSWQKNWTGVGMPTVGCFALVKGSLESRVRYTHTKHISGTRVELPEDMRKLLLSIEDNLSLRKASMICDLQQVRCTLVFAYRRAPLPESRRSP